MHMINIAGKSGVLGSEGTLNANTVCAYVGCAVGSAVPNGLITVLVITTAFTPMTPMSVSTRLKINRKLPFERWFSNAVAKSM